MSSYWQIVLILKIFTVKIEYNGNHQYPFYIL